MTPGHLQAVQKSFLAKAEMLQVDCSQQSNSSFLEMLFRVKHSDIILLHNLT